MLYVFIVWNVCNPTQLFYTDFKPQTKPQSIASETDNINHLTRFGMRSLVRDEIIDSGSDEATKRRRRECAEVSEARRATAAE